MNFQAGDWVRLVRLEGATTPPLQINSFDGIDYIINGMKCARSELVHWRPRLNEWCWFISCNDTFELLKFAGITGTKYQGQTYHGSIFNYSKCEPFIGELPSFLKDNKCN